MTSMRDRFVAAATALLDRSAEAAIVLADISASRFIAAGAVERHPDRIINVGIREQLQISVAAGLALEGFRPIVHSYAPFLIERPFEQIKLDLTHQSVGAVLVSLGASYDASGEGRTHQAPEDVAILSTLPEWEIVVPGHPEELQVVLERAMAGRGSIYIRLAEDSNERPHGTERLEVITDGSNEAPLVVAVGPMLDRVLNAVEGLDVKVAYMVTVRPFDCTGLRAALGTASEIIVVEPYLEGTTANEITPCLRDRLIRLLSIGVPRTEHRHYGTRAEHDRAHRLDSAGIRFRLQDFLRGAALDGVSVSSASAPESSRRERRRRSSR